MIKKLCWWFEGLKMGNRAEIRFIFTTKSGNVITSKKEKWKLGKSFYRQDGITYTCEWNLSRKAERDSDVRELLNKRADELLSDYKKKGRRKLKMSVLDTGDYIVKCEWDLRIELEYVGFEEWKVLKKEGTI